jgi:hypothetical protein
MKIRLILGFLGLCVIGHGQISENKTFTVFADKQDSLMRKAYEKRDTSGYKKLLKEFSVKYNKLSAEDKKANRGYLNGAYYNLCCAYSLLNKKGMALVYFKKSIQAGFYDYAHMQEDSDLNNIRNEAGFKILIQPLRNNYDYMFVIKNASKYNTNENRELPVFTYQAADNPNLVALRKGYNLDSIAGEGNDVSKILNMLHWIHNLVPHDGDHPNPEIKNAMSMIALCKKDNRGLNCRGLSTVLNECYLSMGFKSRFVTCLPKDSFGIDEDCHVIVTVYVPSLKKWIWVDPTFDAYVMNEKGELLSIEEVRERIIDGRPLILNPDANWNHRASETKEYYFYYYMAKNLYMLECSANSEYNTETTLEGKTYTYVDLLPLEYFGQTPYEKESTNDAKKTKRVIYKTNDPDKFWAVPQ